MKKVLFIFFILLISCNQKQSSQNTAKDYVDKTSIAVQKETINYLNQTDTLITAKFLEKNLKEWYNYHTTENPYFSIDSFIEFEEKPLIKVQESFEFKFDFFKVYEPLLSYSPDKSKVIDLFSNQIEFKKLTNGSYGGLYTLLVKPFLIEPKKNLKFHIKCHEKNDLLHDSYWLNDSILFLTGTTISPKKNDYARHYKFWVIDIKHNRFKTWENSVSDKHYHVDNYVITKKMNEYEIWLDDI